MKSFLQNLFGSKSEPIVIVSGLPRSGTSMTMKMLEAGGMPPLTDHIRSPDEDNPKGYYEFERAKKLKEGDTDWLPQAEGKAVKLIGALLMELPKRGHTYRVLFMRRTMEEILASQDKMLSHRGEDKKVEDEKMAALFERHIKEVEDWMEGQPNLSYIDVDYNQAIQDPRSTAEKINQFLGGDLDVQAMAAVVDPSLYRQRKE
jgi:hypothetical protein